MTNRQWNVLLVVGLIGLAMCLIPPYGFGAERVSFWRYGLIWSRPEAPGGLNPVVDYSLLAHQIAALFFLGLAAFARVSTRTGDGAPRA